MKNKIANILLLLLSSQIYISLPGMFYNVEVLYIEIATTMNRIHAKIS